MTLAFQPNALALQESIKNTNYFNYMHYWLTLWIVLHTNPNPNPNYSFNISSAYHSHCKNVDGILLVILQGYMLDLPHSPPWSHPGSLHLCTK